MTKRRKFLLGMGSLAAGGAAAMGTGALSAVEAERNLVGQVAGDGSAYLQITGGADNGDGNTWAVEASGSEVRLAFDGDENEVNGSGLNPDAISWFDEVLRIRNFGEDVLEVWLTSDNDRITFYTGTGENDGNDRQTIMSEANAVKSYPGDGGSSPDKQGKTDVDVGVKVDLMGVTDTDKVFTGDDNFTIHARRAPPYDDNA